MIGWLNDLGYCPQTGGGCQLQLYVANHFINEAMNPVSNKYHLADYVYPTLDASDNEISTWTEDQSFYETQPNAWPPCGQQNTDEWYTGEDSAAMSYFTNISSSQGGYSGLAAYNVIRNGAIEPCIADFSNNSPKWDITPRATNPPTAP